jgi:hypothetical protein
MTVLQWVAIALLVWVWVSQAVIWWRQRNIRKGLAEMRVEARAIRARQEDL